MKFSSRFLWKILRKNGPTDGRRARGVGFKPRALAAAGRPAGGVPANDTPGLPSLGRVAGAPYRVFTSTSPQIASPEMAILKWRPLKCRPLNGHSKMTSPQMAIILE